MKRTTIFFFIFVVISCVKQNNLDFDSSKIIKIEVYKGYPGTLVKMKNGFEKEFINDLNKSKNVGPTKFMKTHQFIIYKNDNQIDTILTNGKIHHFKSWYKSKENLIEKYSDK